MKTYICGVDNCTQEALEPRGSCLAHTCRILYCHKRIKKNNLCRSHICDRCEIRVKVRDNGCEICACKGFMCTRKPLGNELCSRHICRFCNGKKYKSSKTCKFHLCQFNGGGCNSPPRLITDKNNKYVITMLKSTPYPEDIILNIIIPYAGITDSMCPYHHSLSLHR